MCYFITVGIETSKAEKLINAVPRGMALGAVFNCSVLRQLGTGFRTFVLTSGGCSCSLYSERLAPRVGSSPDVKRRKYKKLGWSDAKIERALSAAQSHADAPRGFKGLRQDVRDLLAGVAEDAGILKVFAHFYGSDLDAEQVELTSGPCVSPEELHMAELPAHLDEILSVSSKPHRSAHDVPIPRPAKFPYS